MALEQVRSAPDVLEKVALEKENHPDGFTSTGLNQFSEPLDVTRLPK